jgi:hypothetical protein
MKKTFLNNYVLLLIAALMVSCTGNKSKSIVGKWKFCRMYDGKNTSKTLDSGNIITCAWLYIDYDSSYLAFENDSTFKVTSKNGSLYNKGTYRLVGDTLINLFYKNNKNETYSIKRYDNCRMSLINKHDATSVYIVRFHKSEKDCD